MSGAGKPPSLAARRKALDAEQERLLTEQADLLRALPGMEPALAARAATVLADKLAALATDYETLLEEELLARDFVCFRGIPVTEYEALLEDEQHGHHR